MTREPTEMERRVAEAYQAQYYAGASHMDSIRAAIRAMREPTDEMIDALRDYVSDNPRMDIVDGVRAMIDAASPEGE